MARPSRSRISFRRVFSPRNKSAAQVASAEAQEKRRKTRVKKWRERFKRFSLSAWHESAIVQTVCGLFRAGAESARVVRAATSQQVVGLGYSRALRLEGLEARQMLTVNLGLGDMVVSGYAADDPDTVSIVLLKDVDSGTQFTVTDEGWKGTQDGFRGTGEGEITLQFNSTISAGTQISLNFTGNTYSHGITVAAGGSDRPNLAVAGDQILIYNGGFSNRPTDGTSVNWVTGFQMNGIAAWDADATDASTSAKPTVFVDGTSSFAGFNPEVDNAVLNNLGYVVGTPDAIRAQVYNSANWTTNDSTPPTIPGTTQYFTSIQDALSAAPNGSTVSVLSGTYTPTNFDVDNGKTLKIVGAVDIGGADVTANGGTLQVDGSLTTTGGVGAITGGTIQGTGTINGNVFVFGMGTLAAGTSPGTLAVMGNLTFQDGSTLEVDVDGTGMGQHDLVTVSGNLTINDTSTIALTVGYAPVAGDTVNIVTSASRTGTFTMPTTNGFRARHNAGTVSLFQNTPPVFTDGPTQMFAIPENSGNGTTVGTAGATDADMGDSPTYSIVAGDPNHGFEIFSGTGIIKVYDAAQLDLDYDNGALVAVLTVEVTDGIATVQQTVTVNVTPLNDNTPVGVADAISLDEGGSASALVSMATSVLANDTDADLPGDILTVAEVNGSAVNVGVATPTTNGMVTVNADGTFSYQHDGSETTSDSFTYKVTDGANTSTDVTVTITINPVNDNTPVGVADSITVNEGGATSTLDSSQTSVLFNDTDADLPGDTLTVGEVNGSALNVGVATATTNGTVTVNADGTFTYTHDGSETISDSFTYKVTDGTNTSTDVTVTITITPQNDPAVIGGDTTGSVTEDSGAGEVDSGTLTISDADGAGEESFVPAAAATTYGSYTLAANGDWVYTLDNNNPAVQALGALDPPLMDSFTAVAFDGTTQQVDITINGVDEPSGIVNINGGAGSDSLVIDFDAGTYTLNNGTPQPIGTTFEFNYDGGAGNDAITIIGNGQTATYTPGNTMGDGTITVGGVTINFTGLEPVDISGMALVTVMSPANPANALVLDAGFDSATGLIPAIVVSGNTGLTMTGIEAAHLWDNDAVVIDTSATTGAGSNTITVNSTIGLAHLNDAITLKTNAAGSVIFNADLLSNGAISIDTPTVALNADITTAGKATTAATTTFNVGVGGVIQDAVSLATTNDTINVSAGTFDEDVVLNKDGLKLLGAGASSTTIRGVIGGPEGATIRIAANNLEIAGLTITRNGNNTVDWNDPNLNFAGVAVIGLALTGANVHDNIITGNRTGIDINNSNGHTVQNNIIDNNHTGVILRNQTNNTTMTENVITNNRTVGILFLDASSGTNVPVQEALNSTFSGNNISGNWYGGIVDRQAGGSLPAPGTNPKNFSGNWFGTATPVTTTLNSMEPGYASLIPVVFGGTATNPGGAPDIAGPASANFDYSPFLVVGTDTNLAEFGFQGDYSTVTATAAGTQTGGSGRIDEAIGLVPSGGTINILPGTYAESVDATANAVVLAPGASPGLVNVGSLTLDNDDVLAIEIDGLTPGAQHDQFVVTGTATLGGAAMTTTGTYVPSPGNTFTIIDAATISGAFSTTTTLLNGFPLSVTYPGGGDVVLELPVPTIVWVDDDWTVSMGGDVAPVGLSIGDTVESGVGETAVSGLTFGYNAFSTIAAALAAVPAGGVINVLAGTYVQMFGAVAIDINKDVTIDGQDEGLVSIDANGSFEGIRVQAGRTVGISGITMSNYSTGFRVQGSLALADSTLNGGFVGVWVDGGALDMDSTLVSGAQIFGVQVGGGSADIDDSEISSAATAAASVVVSAGTATIDNSKLTSAQRGLLVNAAAGSVAVHGSSLAGNILRGVENATATPVDASGNWWGTSASPAAVQGQTLGLVDFTPYLHNDETNAARGFTPDNSHVHVTVLGSQTGAAGRVQEGVNVVDDGGLVEVHAGTYTEAVSISGRTGISLVGDGHATTSIVGPHTSPANTATIKLENSSGNTIEGFTITRNGNNTTDWASNGMVYGVQFATNALNNTLENNLITGNRTGIDIRSVGGGGNTIQDNRIDDNRTGIIIWDLANNNLIQRNEITDNWTAGILFLDTSNEATGNVITNNNISGNWYTQVEDRRPTGAARDLSGNWFGTNVIDVVATEGGEPGYAALIPTAFGGSSVPPGPPRPFVISGSGSHKIDYTPWLDSGADSNPGLGFDGDFSVLHVDDNSPQTGMVGRITEGVTMLDDSGLGGGTLILHAGTYTDNLDTTGKEVTIVPGTSPGQIILNGNLSLDSDDTLEIELNGLSAATQYDNFVVAGAVALGSATLVVSRNFAPFPGDEFIIVDNDLMDAVSGMFAGYNEGDEILVGGIPFTISYMGGSNNNDVTLTVAPPNTVWANDTWLEQADTSGGGAGIQPGDTVMSDTGMGDASVTGKIFGYNAFSTIQDAIDAVAVAGTVNVLAGSYTELLSIPKMLDLVGANAGVDARGRIATEAVIIAASASAALIEVSAAGVTIDGFTIDGDDLVTRAIRVNEVDNAIVRNNIITAAVRGVQFNGAAGGNTGGLVEQNDIKNLTSGGSYGVLAFDASYASVVNNDMSGLDVGIFEQYFYQPNGMGNVANVISGNDIAAALLGYGTNERSSAAATTALSNNIYTIGAGGWGVQLFNIYKSNGITLTNETITGADLGVYAYVNGGSVSIANSTITGSGAAGSRGVHVTNFLSYYASYATAFSNVASSLTISGSNISNFETGVLAEDADADWSGDMDLVDDATGAVNVTIDTDTDIFNTGTGVHVSGPLANAVITGNNSSIYGNAVGIDVDGGSATITNNHIYDNTTAGIRVRNGGTIAALSGNNFDDGVAGDGADDNAVDILLMASAGSVMYGGNNDFAGDTFFIDNQTTQNIDATTDTFDELGADANFRIEDKMYHKVDDLSKGLVTWVAGNVYVTVPGMGSTDSSIQRGVDAAAAGDIVNVEAGTFSENVLIAKSVKVIGDAAGGTTLTTSVADSTLFTIDDAGSYGAGGDLVQISNMNLDGAGLASYGVSVEGGADLDTLTVDGAVPTDVANFKINGIFVNAAAYSGPNPSVSALVGNVNLSNLDFANNGISGGGGMGDVNLFGFNNNATFTNLNLVGNRNEVGGTGARLAIQLRGTGDAAGVGSAPMGTVAFVNVDVSGKYRNQMIGIQRYTDVSNLSFSGVELGGATSEITGTFGASLRFDAVGNGSVSSPATVNLGDTTFRGLAGSSAQPHEIEFAPDNLHTFLRADGTNTQWEVGGIVTASALTLSQAFAVEDRILHYVDKLNPTHAMTFGPYKGFVDIQTGKAFITDQADAGLLGDGSIQRGVNIVSAGDTVHVEAGSFSENVLIAKSVKVIGDAAGGTTLTTSVADSTLFTIDDAGSYGAGGDLVQISNMNLDGAGLASYGVSVEGGADLDTLTVDGAVPTDVANFKINGIFVNAAAYSGPNPSVSALVGNVNLSNLDFANNGISGGGGMGDVNLFGFNNNATFTNLNLVGNRNEVGGTGARLAIQLRGTGDAAGVGSAPMGTVAFVNVDVSGKYRNQMIGIQRYTDVSNLSFSGVELGGATSEITGTFGASLRFDAVGNGSVSSPATVNLGDTTFRGLAGSSAQPHEIEFAPDNLHTFLRADGTNTQWEVGGIVTASALTLSQAFAVEDRILHYVDKLNPTHAMTFGPYKGFVDIQTGKAFITDQADAGLLGDGSINRGIDVVTLGGTVHVEDGTYFEDVVVDRSVTVLGDNLPTIHAVDDNDNSSVVIEVRADNVTIQGLDIVVNRDDASGGIAASNVAQADVNMAGGSFNNLAILDNVITPVGENNVGSFILHTSLPATTMGIALIGIGGPAHSVTIQGNQVNAGLGSAPITGGPLAASVFTRGIYLGELQATVGGPAMGDGNTSTGLAQDLLVQFASNGTTTIQGNTFLIAGVDISSPNANSPVNILDNTFAPVDLDSLPGFPLQSLLIRNFTNHATSPITIDGNTFDDFNIGIDVEAGSATITDNLFTNAVDMLGDTTGDAAIGIRVRVGASAMIANDNDISGTATGILVLGSASIIDNDNSINGNGVGIDVNGGTVLAQNNDLNGNTIGVLIRNGGIADLGQTSMSAVNFTGLAGGTGPNGASAGGNDFSAYTAAASATSGAIVNLNTGGLDSNPGRQGAPPDVTAFGNIWDTPTPAGIENVIWHDGDDALLGFVDFAAFGNLMVSVDDNDVNEGDSVMVSGSFTNTPQAHTVTIVWGDGSPNTVINLMAGVFSFNANHPYADDVDGPVNTSVYPISITVEDASMDTISDNSLSVTVHNVDPSIVISGASSVDEGAIYTLTLGAVIDPGTDTVSNYRVWWGDGSFTDYAAAGMVTHTYADGPNNYNITVDLTDEDGTFVNVANALSVTVNDVAPSLAISGASNVNEGSVYMLTLGPLMDPGMDTVITYIVHWGDGGTNMYSTLGAKSHIYADGPNAYNITVDIVNEDGTFLNVANPISVTVNNVEPTIAISGASSVDEGSVYSLTLGAVTEPGTDVITQYIVHWGDGSFDIYGTTGVKTHTYADGPNVWNITVDLVDEDGTFVDQANPLSVTVNNVEPTLTISAATNVNEGSVYSLTLGPAVDPGMDTITNYRVWWGDGTFNDYATTGIKTHTYTDGPNVWNITIDITDEDGTHVDQANPLAVTVDNVAPTVSLFGPTSANSGETKNYTFTTSDPGDDTFLDLLPFYPDGGLYGTVSNFIFNPLTGSGSFDVTFSGPPGPSMTTISMRDTDSDLALSNIATIDVNISNTFRVTGISVNDSGFDFTFNRSPDFTDLNLYDWVNPLIMGDTFKLPDLVVHASIAGIDIKGSVVWDAATNKLSWVKTGSPLGSDNYLVTLFSGSTAFKDQFGNLLDGNSDFVAGDNYVQAIPVSVVGGTPVVSLPDFARGPGQGVDMTANNTLDTTLPVRATGVNVQGVDFKLVYDTTLLTINPANLTAVLPNWSVVASQTVLGDIATLTVAAFANLPAAAFTGTTNVVNIIATVPTSAPYGASQVLRLTNAEVNEINAQDDYAIQKVMFPGDANGSGILPMSAPPSAYTAFDASLIAQVVVGMNGSTGFDATPLTDPAIVGDASGNGSISAFDASLVNQEAAGINTPEVPDETPPGMGGSALYDPQLSIPDNIAVVTGHNVQIPVRIAIEPSVTGIISATYTVNYDPSKLDFISAAPVAPFVSGWTFNYSENVSGVIQVAMSSSTPAGVNDNVPQLLTNLNFFVLHAAGLGSSDLFINPVDPNEAGLIWTKDDGSVDIHRLVGDYNFNGIVDSADYVVWRNMMGMSVPAYTGADGNGDGIVNGADYTLWRSNFGQTFPGAGSGSGTAAGAAISTGDPLVTDSFVAVAASGASGSADFVEMADSSISDSSVARQAALVERQAARDEALSGLVETLDSSRTLTTPSATRVAKFNSASVAWSEQDASDLLFALAAEEKPSDVSADEEFQSCGEQDLDVSAVDELFAGFDDELDFVGSGS